MFLVPENHATVTGPGLWPVIVRCYVPNSGDGLKRLKERIEKWDVQLRKRLQTLAAKKHVLLMGDLNVAHQDKDSWFDTAEAVDRSSAWGWGDLRFR